MVAVFVAKQMDQINYPVYYNSGQHSAKQYMGGFSTLKMFCIHLMLTSATDWLDYSYHVGRLTPLQGKIRKKPHSYQVLGRLLIPSEKHSL